MLDSIVSSHSGYVYKNLCKMKKLKCGIYSGKINDWCSCQKKPWFYDQHKLIEFSKERSWTMLLIILNFLKKKKRQGLCVEYYFEKHQTTNIQRKKHTSTSLELEDMNEKLVTHFHAYHYSSTKFLKQLLCHSLRLICLHVLRLLEHYLRAHLLPGITKFLLTISKTKVQSSKFNL